MAEPKQKKIVLTSYKTGEKVEFIPVARIAYEGKPYVVLSPVEQMEGMGENQAVIFRVKVGGASISEYLEVVTDEAELAGVQKEYERALAEQK